MSLSRPRRGREEGGDDDQRESATGKRSRPCSCSCSCCHEAKDFYEGQIYILKKEMQCLSKGFIAQRQAFQREMQDFYRNSQLQFNEQLSEHRRSMEQCYHNSQQLIWEQFNTLISERRVPGDHVWRYSDLRVSSDQSKTKTYRLKFESKCCNDKYSCHVIKADDGNPIKIAIYDHDNRIITDGPLSSMRVKIVVLDGEFNKGNKEQWSGDSFLKHIVYGRPGKPPLLADELYLKLENGMAILCGVKFQDNFPGKRFRLGVMAADDNISEKILEGVSESFVIKSGRGFQKKKDPHPSLTDPIYKLKKIWENGDRHKLLEKMEIKLVKDFLWFYNKDKDGLRKACANISAHDWEIIVEHALSCKPGHDRYSYTIPEMDATICFNSLYIIVGAEFNGKYSSYEKLNNTEKVLVEASKMKAYDNLKVVQNEEKIPFGEHEVLAGDKGSCYLRGSCSIQQTPTSPTKFHVRESKSVTMELISGSDLLRKVLRARLPYSVPFNGVLETTDLHVYLIASILVKNFELWLPDITILSDDISHHDEVLENGPSQESPHPRQRLLKILTTVVIALHFRIKKPLPEISFVMTDIFDDRQVEPEIDIWSSPLIESSCGMAEMYGDSWVEQETSLAWDDCSNFGFDNVDGSNIF